MSDQGRDRVADLERRLRALEERLARVEARLPEEERPAPEPEATTFEPVEEVTLEEGPPGPSPQPTPTTPRSSPAGAQRAPLDLEARLGGDLLAKAGMVTLVLGVAFFLKYAFDNDWISLPGRILLGVAGGAALFAVGDLLHRRGRYGVYPQVLAAGGAVIVYFSLFAAYAFEEYRTAIGISLALDSLLLGVTALGVAGYATWRNLPTLGGLAVALGAVTALVSGELTAFSVTYLVLITAVITGASAYRRWPHVPLAVLVASHGTLALQLAGGTSPTAVMWGTGLLMALFLVAAARAEPAAPHETDGLTVGLAAAGGLVVLLGLLEGVMEAFGVLYPVALAVGLAGLALLHRSEVALVAGALVAFPLLAVALAVEVATGLVVTGALLLLALYAASGVAATRIEPGEGISMTSVTAALAVLATWGLLLWAQSIEGATNWHGPTTLALAAGAAGLALVPQAPRHSRVGWALAATVTALAWPPLQFDGAATVVAWSAIVMVGAGARTRYGAGALRVGLVAGAALTVVHLVTVEAPDLYDGVVGAGRGLFPFMAASVAMAVAHYAEGYSERPDEGASRLHLVGAALVPLVYIAAGFDDFQIPVGWSLVGLALVGLGFAADLRDVRFTGLAIFGLVLGRVFLFDLAELEVVFRIITFLVVGAVLLGASYLYARRGGQEVEEV